MDFISSSVGVEAACETDFRFQHGTRCLIHPSGNLEDQGANITRGRSGRRYEEVRVELRDPNASDAEPLQAASLDEPAGRISGGVLEDASRVLEAPGWVSARCFR